MVYWGLKNSKPDSSDPENIIIGSRSANFLAIIDHSDGKVVWRLGPDMSKGTAGEPIGQVIGQHHVHMIPYGLPGAGNILVYDNGGQSGFGGSAGYPKYARNYSRILEFDPISFQLIWQYGGPTGDPEHFFPLSPGPLSGFQTETPCSLSGPRPRSSSSTPRGTSSGPLNSQRKRTTGCHACTVRCLSPPSGCQLAPTRPAIRAGRMPFPQNSEFTSLN